MFSEIVYKLFKLENEKTGQKTSKTLEKKYIDLTHNIISVLVRRVNFNTLVAPISTKGSLVAL